MKNLIPFISVILLTAFVSSCQSNQPVQEPKPLASDALKGNIEPYYFSTTLSGEFDTIVEKVTAALKSEGFGVITTIDVQKTFKAKLDLDYKKYLILGACNPTFAHKALEAEDKVGTMLPCNVVIQEVGENTYEVAGVNPIASMMAIDNADLAGIAIEVKTKMQAVIEKLQ
jgi:uncharacterized protein (DUF302 family)